ncbi:MAG: hypothetical protein R2855_13435 [Thermomicrobiales bacterium]
MADSIANGDWAAFSVAGDSHDGGRGLLPRRCGLWAFNAMLDINSTKRTLRGGMVERTEGYAGLQLIGSMRVLARWYRQQPGSIRRRSSWR